MFRLSILKKAFIFFLFQTFNFVFFILCINDRPTSDLKITFFVCLNLVVGGSYEMVCVILFSTIF